MSDIIIDARAALPQPDGLGTYIREIVPRVVALMPEHTFSIIIPASTRGEWIASAPAAQLIESDSRPMWPGQNISITRLIRRLDPDLFFYPAHDPPAFCAARLVFTIHDLSPHETRPYFESLDRAKTAYLRAITRHALAHAVRVIAVSHATSRSIETIFGHEHVRKVRVVPNGGGEAVLSEENKSASNIVLYVGTDRPHKNLSRQIEGFAIATQRTDRPITLELIGSLRNQELVEKTLDRFGVSDRARLRGGLARDQLEESYKNAALLLFASVAEGFGLPIVEAMARQLPVITSNRSACAEIGANGAALLVDPFDPESIAEGILLVLANESVRAKLRTEGRARAQSYTWSAAATATAEVLRSALHVDGRTMAADS